MKIHNKTTVQKEIFVMKTKIKTKTKKRILTILSIVTFIVVACLIYILLPEGYGWFKY